MAFPGALMGVAGAFQGASALLTGWGSGPWIRAAKQSRGDIPAAARALGVTLTEHATILARAKAALEKIEAGMA